MANESSVPFSWQQVDQTLASPMLSELAVEFGKLNQDDFHQIHYQNMGNGNAPAGPLERLRMQLLRSDEFAARQYAMYLEVWRSQQQSLSPSFLRALCQHAIRMLISARTNSVTYELSEEQHRSNRHNSEWLKAAIGEFKRSMERLYSKWRGAAEVDAKTLEHMLAASPTNPDVNGVVTQVILARTQLRIVEARLASLAAQITSCERALSATLLRPPDNYRIKNLEQHLESLKADKKQFDFRKDEAQRALDAALSRSAELRKETVSDMFSNGLVQEADRGRQLPEEAYREQTSATPEPHAGVVGPEREISQARERVRYFEAKIAATDTNIAAFQQSLTQAIVLGTSAFKPRDIDKIIQKLHADRKEFEFRRDDWQLILTTALSRAAKVPQHELSNLTATASNLSPNLKTKGGNRPGIVPNLKYRSPLRRAILIQLTKAPEASDLEVCRGLDADGAVDLPTRWAIGRNRLFESVYKSPGLRQRVEAAISKVRADLRKQGF